MRDWEVDIIQIANLLLNDGNIMAGTIRNENHGNQCISHVVSGDLNT